MTRFNTRRFRDNPIRTAIDIFLNVFFVFIVITYMILSSMELMKLFCGHIWSALWLWLMLMYLIVCAMLCIGPKGLRRPVRITRFFN